MSAFDGFVDDVLDGLKTLAVGVLKQRLDQLRSDTIDFLELARKRLERWTGMLERGEIDEEEFAFLVGALRDLAEMRALTEAGISAARLKRLRNDLISLIVSAAVGRFLP